MRESHGIKQSRGTIHAVGVGVCVAMTLCVYVLGVQPVVMRQDDRAVAAVTAQTQGRVLKQLDDAVVLMRRRLDAVGGEAKDHSAALLPADRVNQQLANVTGLASECGIQIEEVVLSTLSHEEGKYYGTVGFKIAGRSDYRSFAVFLHKLHERFRDTDVGRFELTNRSPASGSALEFDLGLVWYAEVPSERG